MPKQDEVPSTGELIVADLENAPLDMSMLAVGGVPTWYLSNLKKTATSFSFDFVTPITNPYAAGAWWVLWGCSMRDYSYYNSDKAAWNWLPAMSSGTITYAMTLVAGKLYTVALFKDNSYNLADYIEFQA